MENETPDQSFKFYYKVIAPLLMGEGVGDGLTTMCVMSQAACIDALNIRAHFWMALETNYRIALARNNQPQTEQER